MHFQELNTHVIMYVCAHGWQVYQQYTYIHTYIHTYLHTYIHTYIITHIYVYMHTYIRTHIGRTSGASGNWVLCLVY